MLVNPELPMEKTRFSEYLVQRNGLDERGFERWAFYPGMLFNALSKWWGNGGKRERPHEGLDIFFYRDKEGQYHKLGKETAIPVIYGGEVIKIADDFLGKSVYMSHGIYDSNGNQLCTMFGHTRPCIGIQEGKVLGGGDVIAHISDTAREKAGVVPHLHISIAWIPSYLPYNRLDWNTFSDPGMVTLVDPLEIIDCKYTVLEPK